MRPRSRGEGEGRPRGRLRRVLGFLVPVAGVAAAVALLLPGPMPASAAGNGKFSLAPVSLGTTTRTVFTPLLTAGQTSKDSLVVVNETSKPITLELYAADAYTARNGQFAVQPNFKPKKAMGAWIHLPISQVTVPARGGEEVPFSYNPPGNVAPGDYAGGIMAEEKTGTVDRKGTLRLQELQAVGSAVFGQVAGPLHPRLDVSAVSVSVHTTFASQFGGSVDATVTYSVTNTGNETLSPTVTVSLSPLLGGGPAPKRVKLPQILPGSTVTFAKTFDGVVPFGSLSATVTADAPGAKATGTASAVVIPWGLVAIVALVILALLLRRRRRRARQRGAAGPSASGGADGGGRPDRGGSPSKADEAVDAGARSGGSGGP
ncbi:MAG TPA: DUF916 domain-containing protein [Acidimicrobiales bacterium]|nr:DUF916 domain-containing protein [Acidimicrobiales bacterium]